ncbi:MAG: dihydrofolate reductase [Candidatus Yanofskybacteria bacterium]|nr:dihydrofolate reductase [Candidatus Yanofskybacteria bacterium]
MKVSIIVAMDSNNVIGKDNDLPWRGRLPADMDRFKNLTSGRPVIMGRNTYESIPKKFRPLRGRTNIVITSRADYDAPGCIVVHSLQEALTRLESDQVFILGGIRVYLAALPLAQEIYLTLIHHEFEGNAKFPNVDPRVWQEVERENREPDEKNKFRYSFVHLTRR